MQIGNTYDDVTPIQFEIYSPLDRFGFDVRIYRRLRDNKVAVAAPMVLKEHVDGTVIDVAMNLQTREAQSLMDALWQSGVRPTRDRKSVV